MQPLKVPWQGDHSKSSHTAAKGLCPAEELVPSREGGYGTVASGHSGNLCLGDHLSVPPVN